jgi:hypothetical protein
MVDSAVAGYAAGIPVSAAWRIPINVYNIIMRNKRNQSLNRMLIVPLILSMALVMASCQSPPESPSPAALSQAMPSKTPAATPKRVSSDACVLFIGNSLTYMSGIPEKLSEIALSKQCEISALKVTHPGYLLSEHLEDFKTKDYLQPYIDDADIVILQELGKYQSDTVKAIQGFQELFGSGKRYYFLETEYGNFLGNDRELLTNIQFIRSGFVHDQLIVNRTFKFEDLHLKNDPHPNGLYGYLAAFTVFCKINDIHCSDYFTIEEMTQIIGEQNIQGVTAIIEGDDILKIQAAVDAAMEDE